MFFITLTSVPSLDGKHQVIGELIEGHDVLKKIDNTGDLCGMGTLKAPLVIENCGIHNEESDKIA